MSKRTYRRFTAEEKIAILKEAEHPGVNAAEVYRKNGFAPPLLHNWRAVAQDAAGRALVDHHPSELEVARLWVTIGPKTRMTPASGGEHALEDSTRDG